MIKKLMQQIESGNLRYELGYASTTRTLMRRINGSNLVQRAQKQMAYDPSAVQVVFKRAKEIFFGPITQGYLHADDNILATYLFLLRHNALPDVQKFIRTVAKGEYAEFRGANGVAQFVAARLPATTVGQKPCMTMRFSFFHVQKMPDFISVSLADEENEDDVHCYFNEATRHDELREIA